MKARKLIAVLMAIAMTAVLLTACGGDKTPSNTGSGEQNTSSGDTGEVYNLSFTIHDPATSVKTQWYMDLAEQTKEATDGKVNITVYPGGTLVAGTDVAEALVAGTADMGWLYTPFFTGQFPLTGVLELPLAFGDTIASTKTIMTLFEEYPELQEELSQYKVFNIYSQPANMFYSNFPITCEDDLHGQNIRTSSGVGANMIGAWGASPIMTGPGDVYEAMEKGTIVGFTFEWTGVKSFNLDEVVDYCTELPVTAGPFITAMSLDSWNKLPKEYQDIMDEIWGGNEAAMEIAEIFQADYDEGRTRGIETNGIEIVELTDEGYASFKVAADEYIENWIAQNTTDSFDAGAYFERSQELYQQYLAE